jgi:regulator of protease activity HflC (stomatin/prohibitin superfamily)
MPLCPTETNQRACLAVSLTIGLLMFIILLPFSFSYLEYYEYGIVMRKGTGRVDTSKVYARGRYALGPDHTFIKYQADAHHEHFEGLGVFSTAEAGTVTTGESVGLSFEVNIDLTYLLIQDEVGDLHKELATSYQTTVRSRAQEAIKNQATNVTFTQYFQDRKAVEKSFREAIQARWNDPPIHCILDQFHLGRIKIPETVAQKQLQAQLQNERNQMEQHLQDAQVERELTKVDVNAITLSTDKMLATARAEANLRVANARVNAARIVQEAEINGTKALFVAANIVDPEQMTAFMYIRTLKNREGAYDLSVSYLSPESVVRTSSV